MKEFKTKRRLVIAFTILLSIMLFLIVVSLMSMRTINKRLDTIVSNNLVKVTLASDMLHAARERSILLHRMVIIDDPFERDELMMELDVEGSRFGVKRATLRKLSLSNEEKSLLDRQGEFTSIAIPLQRTVIDLITTDDFEQAKYSLVNGAMPAQDQVLDTLKKLITLQNKYADEASLVAQNTYKNSRFIMLLLGMFGIFMGIFISRIFIKQITEIESNLHREKEKAQVTFRSIGDAVITTNALGTVEYVNKTAEQLIGVYSSQAIGKSVNEVFQAYDTEHKKDVSEYIEQYLLNNFNEQPSGKIDLSSNNENKLKITMAISPILSKENILEGLVIIFHDVTKSIELMHRIEYQATRDALTGLLNRREFERKVRQSLDLYERNTTHAFFIVDLDRFKTVNDSCGHQAGDELLKQLSIRMKSSMRKSDLLARIGGDEFAVFLSNINEENAEIHAEELLKIISSFRFLWDKKTFTVGASIGIIAASPEMADYDFLYHSADTACYIAKNEGRNRVHLVSADDSTLGEKKNETDWISKINNALDGDGFYLYGQSVEPLSPRVIGRQYTEILLRMMGHDGKIIPPMAFLPTAERYGLMQRIDQYVLKKVCAFIKSTPLDSEVYAINLSGQTLSSVVAMDYIIDFVKASGISTDRLCLEVTETVAIANLENAKSFMQTMQEIGCYTSLDDFGSGLSSFSYLKNLPLDYIKIDGVFVSEMIDDKASTIMVDAIHSVGKKLGLMTIAEYVEDEETVKLLKEIGVDFAQGYFFSVPELCVPLDLPE